MARKLDEAAVRHVAKLARLRVDEAEIALYTTQLARVLDYVAQLDELDTTGVAPTAHPLDVTNVLRDDEIRPSVGAASAMANAPDTHEMFFRVPKVLDQGGA